MRPSDETRAGVIGLGVMGQAMARRILAGGLPLVVSARSRGPVNDLCGRGAVALGSDAAIASESDVCIVIVPDDPDLERVVLDQEGVLEGAHPGLVVIAMGTHAPSAMRPLADTLAQRGADFLDAPVSGGDIGAREGTLSIMVGGDAEVLERAMPVLELLGRTITHVGPVGAGQVAKACNQLVVGSHIQAVAEAYALARASGVDPARVLGAIAQGLGGSVVLDRYADRMIQGRFDPGGRASLHAKDARIVMRLAREAELDLPAFAAVADAFEELVRRGGGDLDHSALVTLFDVGETEPPG
jgi:2-hydroxy-3-oxopropionate reductase